MTAPRDLANNKPEFTDKCFLFMGVSTEPPLQMVAAKVKGSQNITIVNDLEDFRGETVVRVRQDKYGSTNEEFELKGFSLGYQLDLRIKPYNALICQDASGHAVTYSFDILHIDPSGSATMATYPTQSFVGSLEELDLTTIDATYVTTSSGTIIGVSEVTLRCEELNLDGEEFAFRLVDEENQIQDLVVNQTIFEREGNVVIATDAPDIPVYLEMSKKYKLLVYPLDDAGRVIGSIESITEPFIIESNMFND
jgi:hypothetical protein